MMGFRMMLVGIWGNEDIAVRITSEAPIPVINSGGMVDKAVSTLLLMYGLLASLIGLMVLATMTNPPINEAASIVL